MSKKETFINDYFNTGQVLLDFFKEELSESEYRSGSATLRILTEASAPNDVYTIPIQGHDYPISLIQFMQAYSQPDKYPNNDDILIAQGIDPNHIAEGNTKYTEYAKQKVHELIKTFKERGLIRNPNSDYPLVPFPSAREAYYLRDEPIDETGKLLSDSGKKGKGKGGKSEYEKWREKQFPTAKDAVDTGLRQGREHSASQKMAERINSNELMSGEFYSDVSRIPKRNWAKWFQVFKKEASRLPLDRSWKDTIRGKRWKKSFILGYKLEEGLLLEVWYNSIDSTFTVHDQRGINVTRKRVKTLNEALKLLSRHVSQMSTDDAEVLFTQKNPLTRSVANSLSNTLENDYIRKLQKADNEFEEEMDDEKFEVARKRGQRGAIKDVVKQAAAGAVKDIVSDAKRTKDYFTQSSGPIVTGDVDFVNSSQFKKDWEKFSSKMSNAADTSKDALETISSKIKQINDEIQGYLDEVRELDNSDDTEKQVAASNKKLQARNARIRKQMLEELKVKIEQSNNKMELKAQEIEKDIEEYIRMLSKRNDLTPEEKEKAFYDYVDEQIRLGEEMADKTEKRAKSSESTTKFENEQFDNKGVLLQERIDFDNLDGSDGSKEAALKTPIGSAGYGRMVDGVKGRAENLTMNFIKNHVMEEQIDVYYSTKAPKRSLLNKKLFSWGMKFKKNGALRGLPDNRPIWDTVKSAVMGQFYRADFIVGFQLNNGPKFEIWYVTEPAPDAVADDMNDIDSISTYYVYDIDAEEIVKRYIPYYRNALQVVMLKIGAYNQ